MAKRVNNQSRRVDRPSPMGGTWTGSSFTVNGGGMIPAGTKLNVPTTTHTTSGKTQSSNSSKKSN